MRIIDSNPCYQQQLFWVDNINDVNEKRRRIEFLYEKIVEKWNRNILVKKIDERH